jgi:AcrR family transcriptional regulator
MTDSDPGDRPAQPNRSTQPSRQRRAYAPRVPTEKRRDQLLDAALAVIADSGFDSASMEAVAHQAGVTKPVLYDLYGNRTELLTALLRRERTRAMHQIATAIPADLADLDSVDVFAEGIRSFVTAVIESPQRWTFILLAPQGTPPPVRAHISQIRAALVDQARQLVEQALHGNLDGLDAELIAHTVIAVAEMLGRLALEDPAGYTPQRLSGYARQLARTLPRR